MIYTKSDLHDLVETRLKDLRFVVVSNREPYVHRRRKGAIECIRPASGMATAVHPVMQACGGTWVAHGSGNADWEVVDEQNRVAVPPGSPEYCLKRVALSAELERGYYYGLSNAGLWPLCHVTFTRPRYRPRDWEAYREVNRIFADAVLEEVGDDGAFIFIQDFHFGLLPRLLKEANPKLIVAQFWHIPWPNREVYRTFPWGEELLDGMLGNDLLGFHVHHHCANFMDCVDRGIEARVDNDAFEVFRGGRSTRIRPFPISIDYEQHNLAASRPDVTEAMTAWRERLGLTDEFLGVGIERLDYTKGIPERILGLDYLFENQPDLRGRIRFVQVAVPSRSEVPAYQRIEREVEQVVEQVNRRWEMGPWRPVELVREHQDPVSMMALHRLADFCIVSALHDGMNLVAKEYVASRCDGRGVLILSRFTGSARELRDALLVNPYSIEEIAEAIRLAISMPAEEQERRMTRMREQVEQNNVYRWAGRVLSALLKLDFPEG